LTADVVTPISKRNFYDLIISDKNAENPFQAFLAAGTHGVKTSQGLMNPGVSCT